MHHTQNLDDRTMLLDALVSDKHEASDYTLRSIETANPQLLQLFQSIYRDEQEHVHLFMNAMSQRGWQSSLQAQPQDVYQIRSEAQSKLTGTTMTGMQTGMQTGMMTGASTMGSTGMQTGYPGMIGYPPSRPGSNY
ncbi:MAG: spore coat protein [Bacillota bacterium]